MWSVRIKQNWAEQPKKDDTPGCRNIKPNSMTGIKQGFSSKVAVEIYCKTELDDWHQARFLFQGSQTNYQKTKPQNCFALADILFISTEVTTFKLRLWSPFSSWEWFQKLRWPALAPPGYPTFSFVQNQHPAFLDPATYALAFHSTGSTATHNDHHKAGSCIPATPQEQFNVSTLQIQVRSEIMESTSHKGRLGGAHSRNTRPLLASTHFTSVAAESTPTNKHKHVATAWMPRLGIFHSVPGW